MLTWLLFGVFVVGGYILMKILSPSGSSKKQLNLPPRPFTVPFLGTLNLLAPAKTRGRNTAFLDLGSKYGGIFRIKIGRRDMYIVTSYDIFREATVDKPLEFVGRTNDFIQLTKTNPKRLGIVEGGGSPDFMQHRRFVLVKLRSLGFGTRSMEDCILVECNALINEIEKCGQGVISDNGQQLRDLLRATTSNIIFSVLCTKRYEYNDPTLTAITRAGTGLLKESTYVGVLMGFPFLTHVTSFLDRAKKHLKLLHTYIDDVVEDHWQNLPANEEEARDFMDIYLLERRKELEAGETETFSKENLAHIIEDLYVGAVETTATSIQWLLLAVLHHPDLKRRVQAELDELRHLRWAESAENQLITLADINYLPLTMATIWEVFRMFPVVPFGVPHASFNDAKLGGYDIEKETAVLYHLWGINHDPKLWSEPEKFNPDRYLVPEDGEVGGKLVFKQPEKVVVFSVGRRSCIGEQLARKETFLLIANLLQAFDIEQVEGTYLPDLQEKPGILMYPPDFPARLTKRRPVGTSVYTNGSVANGKT